MQANPLWPVKDRFPSLQKDIRKDVLVVGGGMAGVSSALQLSKNGYDVALITRDEVGGPATGASSGVLYYGSGTNLAPAVKLFGEETAFLLWKETAGVIEQIVKTATDLQIDCGLRTCGSIMVAKNEPEIREIEEEMAAIKRTGLPARQLGSGEVKDYFPLRGFEGGVSYDGVGQIHPARLAAGAARAVGLEIYEGSPMVGWKEEGGGVAVQTPRNTVRCADLVIATNKEPCFGLENSFGLESSVILSSKPTPSVKDVFPTEKIYWTMEDKYDLFYPRGDRLILELYALGDERDKIGYYFPGVDFQAEFQWGETWAKAEDWVPIVGKVADHVTVAIGMGDQGIIMSWLSGLKIPMLLQGKEDWFTRMASPGRFVSQDNKAEMAPAATADELVQVGRAKDVPPGKMKIFVVGGTEIAIANVGGEFFGIPNVCTHAGGPLGKGKLSGNVVQCPFHGSKFDVRTGAVVGPPATTPVKTFQVKSDGTNIFVRMKP